MLEKKPKRSRKTTIIVGAIVAIVLVAGGFLIYQSFGSSAAATEYSTSTIAYGTIENSITGSGTLESGTSTDVTPEVSGTVYDLKVAEGDTVTKGQVLFSIKNDSLDTAVTQAASEVTQAKAQLTSAYAQLSSANSLTVTTTTTTTTTTTSDSSSNNGNDGTGNTGDSQSSSAGGSSNGVTQSEKTQQIASAKAAVSQAQAQVTSAQDSYSQAVENAENRTVKAPAAGTVTSLNVTEGGSTSGSSSSSSSGGAGGTGGTDDSSSSSGTSSAAVVISDYSTSMTATITVTESDLPSIKLGQEATLTFDAIDGLSATGTVTKIATTGTVSNSVVSFDVEITIPKPDSRLRPGMNVSAKITLEKAENVLVVDNGAITMSPNSASNESTTTASSESTSTATTDATVLVVTDTDKMTTEVRNVVLGLANDVQTQVISGLKEGEVVVTGTIDTSTTDTNSSTNQQQGGGIMMETGIGPSGGSMPPSGGNGGF